MVVEQKFKVLRKAEKEIYENTNSNLRKIEKNSAELREFEENSHAWALIGDKTCQNKRICLEKIKVSISLLGT